MKAHESTPQSSYDVYIDLDIADLIPEYLDNRREDIRLVERALEHHDYGSIQEVGHKMKGSGGWYGFSRITEIGQQLEESAKAENPSAILAYLGNLNDYLEHVHVIYQEE